MGWRTNTVSAKPRHAGGGWVVTLTLNMVGEELQRRGWAEPGADSETRAEARNRALVVIPQG